jgi:peptidylprolyl isomerase
MEKGETRTISIPVDKAYGPHHKDLIHEVDRKDLPSDMELEIGQQLEIHRGDGTRMIVTIADFTGAKVKLDANHPLAGKDLTFDIQLMEIH